MRIMKSQTIALLRAENSLLGTQKARCRRQASKFSHIAMGGMRGASVAAAQERLQMRGAIVAAHQAFYESLYNANQRNSELIGALPETSSGVLDTSVATSRIQEAQQQIRVLEERMREAIERAQAINNTLFDAVIACNKASLCDSSATISIDAVHQQYEALIECQRCIVRINQDVLEKASAYDRESLETYRTVETSLLSQAQYSSKSYLSGRGWGDTSWALGMYAALAARKKDAKYDDLARMHDAVTKFLDKKIKAERSVVSGRVDGETSLAGVYVGGAASGEVLGVSASIKPYAKGSEEEGKDAGSASLGGKAEVEVYGAKGKLEGDAGIVHGDVEGKAVVGAVSGTLGVSLFSNGTSGLGVEVGAKAEGSVLSAEGNLRVGAEDYNVHAKAKGKVLDAKAEAKLKAGAEGLEAKVGAEAYVATGELSGGLTILGVKIDATVEGKVGGAGGKVGASVEPAAVEGEVGAGLLLGAGIKVKVDWSSAGGALSELGNTVENWWNDLAGG